MATPPKTSESQTVSQGFGTQIPFQAIKEPGSYVCNWSGHLLRVPEEALKLGHSPLLSIKATEVPFVTKISDDPFIPLTKARMFAADCDSVVNF